MNVTTLARAARRHWWVVCAGFVTGLVSGASALIVSTAVYSSSTSVLVQPVGTDELNLFTEAQLARSTDTATTAAAILGRPYPDGSDPDGSDPDGSVPVERVSVEPLPGTPVLIFRYEATTPQAARDGARAFAEAYLVNRAETAQKAIDDQVSALNQRISEFAEELAAVNARIARLDPTSPDLAGLRSSASALTTQITTLTTRLNELATTTVTPGRVIQQADLPTEPARPEVWLYLTCGAGVGVLIGLAGAWARDRLPARVRHAADVTIRLGLPLLAQLPGDGTAAGVLGPRDAGGRAFNRLRNEVVASLTADDRVILVTGANPGPAATIVAANLAAALARADNEVVLVGANGPDLGAEAMPLAQLFDVGDIPGLTDVLAGRASLSRAVQRAPRIPRLRLVTPGGTASSAGLLQSEAARGVLQELCRRARYVVVEAPSAAAGADAQSLAGAADAAILVAESGRARYAELADAAAQLRLMGTRLLGAVVLPRVLAPPPEEATFQPLRRAEEEHIEANEVWLAGNGRASIDPPTAALHQVRDPSSADQAVDERNPG